MPSQLDSKAVGKQNDKRVRLTTDDKEHILGLKKSGVSIHEIARQFEGKCSRRLIQFVVYPERDQKLKEQVKKEKRWLKYYTAESRKAYMRAHRAHKRQLFEEGKIK